MRQETKLDYTDSARVKLEELKQRHALALEEVIRSRKFVPGERTVEVTALDLEDAERRFVLVGRRQNDFKYRLLYVYAFLGGILCFASLLYDQFSSLARNEPFRLVMFFFGFVVSVFSVIMAANLKYRQRDLDGVFLEQQRRVSELLAKKSKEQVNQ